MAHATDIVGYSYDADTYCPSHVVNPALFPGRTMEEILDGLAETQGIDRTDEASFDSSEFPKVITRDQAGDSTCGACHVLLADAYPHGTTVLTGRRNP